MTITQALILGVVQGVTEFLPISSSGHLILVPSLLGWEIQDVSFDAILHLATLAAIFAAMWPDIHRVVHGLKSPKTDVWGRLGWFILAATIPAVVVGFLFDELIETALRQSWIVALSLAFWGILLIVADRAAAKRGAEARVERVGFRRAMAIGCMQALALIPGTSRSGVTITAGLFAGFTREAAARFSFLLGIPAIAAGGALAASNLLVDSTSVEWVPLAVGFLSAFVSGLLSIRFLLAFLKRASFVWFGVYRIVLALVVLLLV